MLGNVIVCWVVADFLSGLFHWAEDTYCTEGYPLIGPLICDPNIEHHRSPKRMLDSGFVGRNYVQVALCLTVFGVIGVAGLATWQAGLCLLFLSFSNEVHAWNHSAPKGFARLIKDAGLVQSSRQHSLHHKPPHDRYYCVLGDATNVLLECVGFWRKLEWCVLFLVGVSPVRRVR